MVARFLRNLPLELSVRRHALLTSGGMNSWFWLAIFAALDAVEYRGLGLEGFRVSLLIWSLVAAVRRVVG